MLVIAGNWKPMYHSYLSQFNMPNEPVYPSTSGMYHMYLSLFSCPVSL